MTYSISIDDEVLITVEDVELYRVRSRTPEAKVGFEQDILYFG